MTRKIAILGLLACALLGAPGVCFAGITGLSFSASPSTTAPLGTPVTLTATVTPANAGGTVTFFSGFTDLGGAAVNSSGVATFSVLLPLGSQNLKAVYILGSGQTVTSTAGLSYSVTAAAGTGFGLVPGTGSGAGANGSTVQADFNNDGKMDIAYVNSAGQIVIALGRENGTFTAEAGLPVLKAGTNPVYLAVGDFNGDGNMDLAYTSGGSTANQIIVYLGNGDGSFGPSGNGRNAAALTVNTENQLWSSQSFFENTGSFNPLVSLAVGDFNNDGIPDLITTTAVYATDTENVVIDNDWWMPQVIVLLGDGTGNFPTQKTSELDGYSFSGPSGNSINSPYGIAIGDFSNDGKADVVISAVSQAIGYNGVLTYEGLGPTVTGLYLFTGRGDGTFTPPTTTLPSPGGPTNFVAGDFNGDGFLDLAVNGNAGNVQVLLNQAPTTPGVFTLVSTPSYISAGGFGAMATGDFNGDGKLDLAMSAGSGVASVLGNGNGAFGEPSVVTQVCGSAGTPGGILTADYGSPSTADNARDSFLAACTGSEAYAVGLGRGPTTIALTATDTTNPATIGETATLTAAVTPNTATGKVTFYSGTKILGTSSLSSGTAKLTDALMPPSSASAGLALLARYEGDASNGVSAGSLSLPVKALPATGFAAAKNTQTQSPQVIVQADFNQDGTPDLAVSDGGSHITILLGNGDGTYTAQSPVLQSAVNAHGMSAVDVNGDGFPDLVLLDLNQIAVYLGDGTGVFTLKGSPYQFQGVINNIDAEVKVADFNVDGIPDLAVATDNGSGYVIAFLGNGDGTFQSALTSEIANNATVNHLGREPQAMATGDFNNDGIPDLLVLAQTASGYDLFPMIGQGDGTFAIGSVSPLLAPGPPAGNQPFLTAGDFNGDGFQDVAYLDTSNNLWVALGSASGVFSYTTTAFGTAPRGFATGDFNGDGKLDLAAILAGQVAVLYGGGQGAFTTLAAARKFSVCGDPKSIVTSDYNGDGRSDFALACGSNNYAQAYLGQGLSLGPLNPASTVAGAGVNAPFTLTITAPNSNFATGDVVNWLPSGSTTSTSLPATVAANGGSLTVTISGSPNDTLLHSQGTAAVSVTDPAAAITSNSLTFTIGPAPAISSITPLTAAVGGTSAPITIAGSNLAQGDTLNFQPPGGALITGIPTTFANNALTATLPQSALTAVGSGSVIVVDGSSGVASVSGFPFNIVAAPALTTLNPTTTGAGGQSFSLTINGTGFVTGDTVSWTPAGAAAQPLTGAVVNGSGTQITVSVPTILLAAVGTASVTVTDPDGGASTPTGGLPFSIVAPSISVLNPASVGTLSAAAAGTGSFTLLVNGSNFIPGTTVNNVYTGSVVLFTDSVGTQHTLTPTASTASQLQVTVPNSYIGSSIASLAVAVENPGLGVNFSGGAVSTAVQLAVAAPVISSVNPPAETIVPAGSTSPVLTVNGANFVATSVLAWCNLCGGTPTVLTPASTPTTNQFSVSIPTNNPNLLAATGSVQIWVANDPANLTGLSTNSNPATNLQIASLALSGLSPSSALAGGPAFSLTITGLNQNFNGAAQVLFGNGLAPIAPASSGGSITGGSITVTVPASYIATPGTLSIQVQNPGGAISAPLSFPIQQLSVSNVLPSPLVAGSAALNLDIQGTSFSPATSIVWTSGVTATTLTPTYNSSTDLSAVATQALLAQAATVEVTASVNVQGVNIVSAPYTVTIVGPAIGVPVPSSAVVNGGAFPLQISGSNFLNGSTVRWTDGTGTTTSLITSYVSPTQLTALVTSSLLTSAGTALITVVNPAPSGSTGAVSNAEIFAVGPTPTINTSNGLSVCPGGVNCTPSTSVTASSPSFLLKVTGSNYQSGSIVVWNVNGSANNLVTEFTDAADLEATVPAYLLTTVGSALITVLNPGNAVSNGIIFNVSAGATPVITNVLPANGITVGSAAFELTVTCANFTTGAQVNWTNGGTTTGLSTVVQDPQTLVAVVPANLVTAVGTAFLTVVSAGATSNSTTFSINPVPTVTLNSLVETSVAAGSAALTLGLVGTNFTSSSVAQWNAGSGVQALTTIYTGPTSLSALVPATLLATSETAFINVGSSGGVLSNSLPFTVSAAVAPSISANGLSPASAIAGSGAFELIVNGQNFDSGSQVEWNSGTSPQALPTVFVNASELTVVVPASLVAAAGTAFISVVDPGGLSSGLTSFVISSPTGPTIVDPGGLSPASVVAAGAAFQLSVTGSNFVSGATVEWAAGGTPTALTTAFLSASQLTALVPAALIANTGTVFVSVSNPNGTASNLVSFTISAVPGPTIASSNGLNPSSAITGSAALSITVTGANFVNTSVVQWNTGGTATPLTTGFVSATQLTALVPANLLAAAATALINVANTGGALSNSLPFTVSAAAGPSIGANGLNPASAIAGSGAFQLTVTGQNFVSGSVVQWNTSGTPTPLTTGFVSATQLTALVPATLLATAETAFVSVANSTSALSNSLSFTITAAAGPSISANGLSPASAIAGAGAFELVVNGQNFVSGSQVEWNSGASSQALSTVFVNASELTVVVPASLVATAGTAFVSVMNPGGLSSGVISFVVGSATGPTIVSPGGLSPASVVAGGAAFQLSVTGSNFVNGATVEWEAGGTPTALTTAFISGSQLTALVPAALIANTGTVFVGVSNPNGTVSNLVSFTIGAVPGPTIATTNGLNPASAPTGSAALTMTITGANFVNGSVAQWNTGGTATPLTTGFVSATQLTALVPASMLAAPATALVVVVNPNMTASNTVTFSVAGPAPLGTPTLTSVAPASAVAGSGSLTLTVTGTNFAAASSTAAGSVVQWDGASLVTTFVSATQLTAQVSSTLLQTPGTNYVAVLNGNISSTGVTFPVSGPTATSVAPATITAGSAQFNLVVTGTNFVSGSSVVWSGTSLATAFNSATQVTAQVPANLVATAGSAFVLVSNPGGSASSPLIFTISVPPAGTITGLSPASAVAGGAAFQLFVTGSGFVSGSTVVWNGSPLPTGFVSATQVTALVGANLISLPGSANVAVQNPGAPVSATLAFPVSGPTIVSVSPTTANAGDPAFTLTVTGTNFVPGTAIQWNGALLPTAYSSSTQVQAAVSASLIAAPATISVTAQNPGGATSPSLSFIVGQPALSITTATLPDGVVGTLYSQTLVAQGGSSPYTWTITAGTLPGGVSLNASSGTMSGTPTGAASVTLSLTVTDSVGRTAMKSLSLQVYLALGITTLANLPVATAGTAYSEVLAAAGGSPPYLWSLAGNLPPGLSLNVATGQISGVPSAPGAYSFTINVTDSREEQNASLAFTATVTVASLTIGGLAASASPAQQVPVTVSLGSTSAVALSGTLTVTFTPQVGGDDPSIQFSTGGRTVAYTIPAGSATAVFPQNSQLLLTTGTVAGTITIKASLQAGSTDITPSPAPQATTAVPELAPVITKVTLQSTTGGVTVTISGYATSKQVTQATLQFNAAAGSSLTASTITVPLTALITAWYQSTSAASFGSQFTVSIPINAAGSISAIGSVTVTLTNAQGNSSPATATLQ